MRSRLVYDARWRGWRKRAGAEPSPAGAETAVPAVRTRHKPLLVMANWGIILERTRARLHLGHAAAAILVVAAAGFLRALQWVADSGGIEADPHVRRGLLWMLGLFCLVVGSLAVALWHWGRELEAQRQGSFRLRRLFGVMNGLQDGLLAVNREGRVLGGNREARRLAACSVDSGCLLRDCYPYLTPDRLEMLLEPEEPRDVVVHAGGGAEPATYRFRSYPSRQVRLILLSDITAQEVEASTREQLGQLETIGRIAQGVAHDFNNILCAISAHAALLARCRPEGAEAESVATIGAEANRGAILARQLVDLSRPVDLDEPPIPLRDTIDLAVGGLMTVLSAGWKVEVGAVAETLLPAMPARHLEQLLVRFGLQLAEAHEQPGVLHVVADERAEPFRAAEADASAPMYQVYLAVTHDGAPPDLASLAPDPSPPLYRDGGGVIQSVILSLLERYGGALEVLIDVGGFHAYRVSLAPAAPRSTRPSDPGIGVLDLAGCRILLVRPALGPTSETQQLLREMGADVVRANNVVGAYSRLGEGTPFRAVFVDELLLGMDPEAALTRILRLQPEAAVVLVRDAGGLVYPLDGQVASLVRPVSRHAIRLALRHAAQMAQQRGVPTT